MENILFDKKISDHLSRTFAVEASEINEILSTLIAYRDKMHSTYLAQILGFLISNSINIVGEVIVTNELLDELQKAYEDQENEILSNIPNLSEGLQEIKEAFPDDAKIQLAFIKSQLVLSTTAERQYNNSCELHKAILYEHHYRCCITMMELNILLNLNDYDKAKTVQERAEALANDLLGVTPLSGIAAAVCTIKDTAELANAFDEHTRQAEFFNNLDSKLSILEEQSKSAVEVLGKQQAINANLKKMIADTKRRVEQLRSAKSS